MQNNRHRLPDRRVSQTFDLTTINWKSFTVTVGFFEDGSVGEIFVDVGRRGSSVNAMAATWSMLFSVALQYGAPLNELIHSHKDFEYSEESQVILKTMNILRGFLPPENGATSPVPKIPLPPQPPFKREQPVVREEPSSPTFTQCPACSSAGNFNYTRHETTCSNCGKVVWRTPVHA